MQFTFGDHALDTDKRELRRSGEPIAVEPQVFDLLIYLIQNRDRVVSKDDLFAEVWGGRIVADSTLATRINAARKAIGDSGNEQRLIRTIARRGVRFVGDVQSREAAIEFAQAADPSLDERLFAGQAGPPSDRPAIAVLPFVNMSGEAEQEYFSDGISEDIITALSKLRWFFVIARNSSFAYKGKSVHIRQIAKELGVDYVIEGSVRKAGERIRIAVQLNDVTTGSHLGAERYDREVAGVFAVQDEITEAIVATIEPQLYAAENFRARRKAPESLDAWDLVMRALSHFWRMTREDNFAAQALLERAIALDPNYAQAHAVLAVSHTFGAHMGWQDAATATPIAERAALAAVRADGEDPWAHLAMAAACSYLGRLDDALAAYELALRLNPNFSLAQGYYGLVLSWTGRGREGTEAVRRALRLSPRDPLSAIYYGVAGYAAFVEGDYSQAIRLCRESVRQRNDFVGGYRVLAAAAGMAGETELAIAALRELRRVQPNISLAWIGSQLPFRAEQRERFLEGLRRAGLD
ncbi:winged helix-turn-helix domain-containing tetratricopeptide repeat protein [Bradyrhizobium sp. NP1]|uniref:winged helix-turn-helix domain-containing tetratricopeptide repeat protein n=1 Tax=Bradyrhizobium sp. NP1 TaxID=3049772 RepID=UPI0025A58CD1|nr:winged helix-turn-helix domain-containing tetratricopeptide repeat protein [Bradyrhizobium sp. NP1]WJR81068.1 winged helix-turn-helix domain-containing tetratricopeptide repeat protein [Bradyrhizobium sp. NP1]